MNPLIVANALQQMQIDRHTSANIFAVDKE